MIDEGENRSLRRLIHYFWDDLSPGRKRTSANNGCLLALMSLDSLFLERLISGEKKDIGKQWLSTGVDEPRRKGMHQLDDQKPGYL